ncbi:MAG: type II toxin-antitoxin system HicB family antitoxin [Deltaproteobacteria bacterium]|nr:type II toxin-antitoxin system HicB family antitoxin [Deltaproteobacteria bacterium]
MKSTLTYKGFLGTVNFSAADKAFHGKIAGVTDLVTFEGGSVGELIKAFHEAVDDYLDLCKEAGKEPLKSYSGSFNVRVPRELHGRAIRVASARGVTLNKIVQTALEHEVKGAHCYMAPFKAQTKRKRSKRAG